MAGAGSRQRLRLEQQVDVELGGVEGHRRRAQDDVERRLVEQIGETSLILWHGSANGHRFQVATR